MKEIDKKEVPDVSGGYAPEVGCFPPFPVPIDYPKTPIGPFPEPHPGVDDPSPFGPVE